MNDSSDIKTWTSTRPSARRPIHSSSSLSHNYNMGRYGLTQSNTQSARETSCDEVDNIISKPARITTPTLPKRDARRKSLTDNQSMNELCSEDGVLSKSLPASFLSSYYSDEITDEDSNNEEEDHNRSNNTASNRTRQMSTSPTNSYHFERSQSFNLNPHLSQREHKSKGSNGVVFGIIGVIVSVIVYLFYGGITSASTSKMYYDQTKFSSDLQMLGEKYNCNIDSILQVESGIETIFKKEDTGSFTFVYDSRSSNFNQIKFENFVNDVASTAAKYLRNNSTEAVRHIEIDVSDLKMQTHGELVDKYREQIEKTGVMLVKELENLPSNLAMAFHYYCDEYNPLIKKSAILFTLDLGKCSDAYGVSTSHAVIENCLKDKWRSVHKDSIGPLLTRVISVVVDVYSIF